MKKIILLALLSVLIMRTAQAQELKPFKDGDRVAFLGNSITEAGFYESYIWLYYMTRFPDMKIRIMNGGIVLNPLFANRINWLTNWLLKLAKEEPWYACFAAMHVGSEFQFAGTMGSVLKALREKYEFTEHEIEHFWVHAEADVEHGGSAMDALERHMTTKELRDAAVRYIAESSRRTWFYNDCIYLHYEQGQLN